MKAIVPSRPDNLDPLARDMLERLGKTPEAVHVILGGGVALNCYAPPRFTHDVDAWWSRDTRNADRNAALSRLRGIAEDVGRERDLTVFERARSANEVASIELQGVGVGVGRPSTRRTVFSFQVAPRDVELEAPLVDMSPFAPVRLEALADNLAAKMTALVARGAPRDFQDVFRVVEAEIVHPDELWALYKRKNRQHDVQIAKAEVLQRLGSLVLRRPIDTLEPQARPGAVRLRAWVRDSLVGNLFPNLELNRDVAGDGINFET